MVALLQLAKRLGKGVEGAEIREQSKEDFDPMDTMEITKIVGAVCGALLIYLLTVTASDALFTVGKGGHGGDHGGEAHGEEKVAVLPASIYAAEEEVTDGDTGAETVSIEELLASADAEKGAKVFAKCKACHKLADGENGTGPHLFAVVDRPVGAVDGFSYSAAMADFGGTWNNEVLNGFLENPKKYMPGTKMSFAGLKKDTDRANLIAYLATVQ